MSNLEKPNNNKEEVSLSEKVKQIQQHLQSFEKYLQSEGGDKRLLQFFEQEAFVEYLVQKGDAFVSEQDSIEFMEEKLAHLNELQDFFAQEESQILSQNTEEQDEKMLGVIESAHNISLLAHDIFDAVEKVYVQKIEQKRDQAEEEMQKAWEEQYYHPEAIKQRIKENKIDTRLDGVAKTLKALVKIIHQEQWNQKQGKASRYSEETLQKIKARIQELYEEGQVLLKKEKEVLGGEKSNKEE